MNVVLFDEEQIWKNFLPLTFTRPVSELRIGILTIKEKWEEAFGLKCSYLTQTYLSKKYTHTLSASSHFINSKYCPSDELCHAIIQLKPTQGLFKGNELIAFCGSHIELETLNEKERINFPLPVFEISNVWDLFQKNGEAVKSDFKQIIKNKTSQQLSETVTVIGDKNLVFLEPGAKAEACILNTKEGPVYIGEEAEIMEGCVVRGPFALCEHSTLKMSAKIYGATTIGPHCKVGGEVSNSVMIGYSNKAHDGFLGNSVVGEWCNLGADTNNSNLKNNYQSVKLYHYGEKKQVDTGQQFCGLIMGDHSKSGINTMFNTGTVVGVGCNIYGGGFPATHIPDFSWGGAEGFDIYKLEKLFETADKVYERRGLKFSELDKNILNFLFTNSQ